MEGEFLPNLTVKGIIVGGTQQRSRGPAKAAMLSTTHVLYAFLLTLYSSAGKHTQSLPINTP